MLKKLLIVGVLLLTSCGTTRTVYVKPTPCYISPFPKLAVSDPTICNGDMVCYTLDQDYEITKFLFQVARWKEEVKSCNAVRLHKVPVVSSRTYDSQIYSILESF
jgi:hypothetical protein